MDLSICLSMDTYFIILFIVSFVGSDFCERVVEGSVFCFFIGKIIINLLFM